MPCIGHLNVAIANFVPIRSTRHPNYPSWFSAELISLIKEKKRLHVKYKKTNLYSDYLLFSNARSRCKALSKSCWVCYVSKAESAIPGNAKLFWRFANSLRTDKSTSGSLHIDGVHLVNPEDISEGFADHFKSVYQVNDDCHQSFNSDTRVDIPEFEIGLSEVFETLSSPQSRW